MIATPVRFAADTITRPIALDVSRDVFIALNQVELFVLLLLLLTIRVTNLAARYWAFAGSIALIVLAQTIWLTPELSARTDIVIGGGEPPDSYLHASYSILEVLKLTALSVLGFLNLNRSTRP